MFPSRRFLLRSWTDRLERSQQERTRPEGPPSSSTSYGTTSYEPRAFGNSWRLGTGTDITLSPLADGSYIFEGANGLSAFEPLTGGGFTKPPGLNATLVRNADGSYTVKADRGGEKLNFAAAGGPLRSHVDRNGNTISFTYAQTSGGALRLASIRDTQGRDTLLGYGDASSSKVTSVTDPAGRRSSYSYVGNLLQSYTAADGSLTGYSYDSGENLTAIADARSGEVRLTYDANRRVTSVSRLLDYGAQTWATTRFSYDLVNRRTVVTDPNGNNTSYEWDSLSRVTSVTDAAANVFRTSYTANSDVDTTTSATGAVTDNDYDANNKLILTRLPTGATTSAAYADAQNPYLPTTVTDAQGKSVTYSYDARGNVLASTNQLQSANVSRWTYNANGTVATATDALGNVTSYSYFANGNLQRVTPPAPLGSSSYTYDSLSRVATETDGKGQTKTYGYDALDRMLSISYPGAAAPIEYRYDVNGNQVGVSDPAGGSTFWYDEANRKITEWGPNNSGTGMGTYYTYDPAGNLLSMRDARGTTGYAYNALHQTTGVTEPDNANNVTRFTYDANGNRTQTIYPNGVTQFEQYDASERLTRIYAQKVASGQMLTDFTYSYSQGTTDRELVQRMTDLGTRLPNQALRSTTYSYNAIGNLTGATTQIAGSTTNWWLYAYDGHGNRTMKTHNDAATSYVYNAAGELATATAGNQTTIYSYDRNGNRTGSSAGQALTYNALDQTTSITPPTGGAPIPMTYAGAGQGQRVAAGTSTFVNDGLGLGSRTVGGSSTRFTRGPDGELIELDQAVGWDHYYLFDGAGSVVATTGADGAIVDSYEFDSFGDELYELEPVDNPWEAFGDYEDEGIDLSLDGGGGYYDAALADCTQTGSLKGVGDNREGFKPHHWLDGICKKAKAKSAKLVYRIWDGVNSKIDGLWVTSLYPFALSKAEARKGWALPEENTMKFVSTYIIPQGTRYLVGLALGGLQQMWIITSTGRLPSSWHRRTYRWKGTENSGNPGCVIPPCGP